MTLRFGTDGVRGDAATELTSEFVHALGRAAGRVVPGSRWVVGRDTRESGLRIERAFSRGLAAEGHRVDLLEVVPTPGVARLSVLDDVPGAMISASHNPWPDNGIKLFLAGGRKLTGALEQRLEAELEHVTSEPAPPDVEHDELAPGVTSRPELVERYRAWLAGTTRGGDLTGLRVLLDCANGAAFELAPRTLADLGATVEVHHAAPDGRNINEGCGSTDTTDLRRRVPAGGFDLGLAFDGDADRVLAVDERGGFVDGDQIIAMCALDRHRRGVLTDDTVVVTVMSNLGFRERMAAADIKVIETPVGDRHVLEVLDERGLDLGGEQSGHVIFRDLATTGDGILTGLQVGDLLVRSGRPLSELAADAMVRYPQVLRNVRVARRDPDLVQRIRSEIAAAEAELGDHGRVLIRPSGTEPVVRVMVEAPTEATAGSVADRLVAAVEQAAGT